MVTGENQESPYDNGDLMIRMGLQDKRKCASEKALKPIWNACVNLQLTAKVLIIVPSFKIFGLYHTFLYTSVGIG